MVEHRPEALPARQQHVDALRRRARRAAAQHHHVRGGLQQRQQPGQVVGEPVAEPAVQHHQVVPVRAGHRVQRGRDPVAERAHVPAEQREQALQGDPDHRVLVEHEGAPARPGGGQGGGGWRHGPS